MTVRSRRWLAVHALITLTFLVVPWASPAVAESPDEQGWWYAPRREGLPVQAPTPDSVPDDGLYVELTLTGANAVAAVRGTVPADSTSVRLVLDVVGSTGDPIVGACPTTGVWEPAQGGTWEGRALCDGDQVATGELNDDGSLLGVDITAFVDGGRYDVALIPADADGAGTFDISFAAPGPNSVEVTAPTTTTTTTTTTSSGGGFTPPTTQATTTPTTRFTPRPQTSPTTAFRPAPNLQPTPEPSNDIAIPPLPDQVAQPNIDRPVNTAAGDDDSDRGRLIGLLLANGVAAAYFGMRGRAGPQPAPIIDVGGSTAAVATAAPTPTAAVPSGSIETSGIGRFAKPRSGNPPPLL